MSSAAEPIALDCPVCKCSVAVPPISLDVCGHTLCAECLDGMRRTEGTLNRPRVAGFRCPVCRRLAHRYLVSMPLRALAQQRYDADDVERDRVFMRRYEAEGDGPAPPTRVEHRRALLAEAGVEDFGGDGPHYYAAETLSQSNHALPYYAGSLDENPSLHSVARNASHGPMTFTIHGSSAAQEPLSQAASHFSRRLIELAIPLVRAAAADAAAAESGAARPPPTIDERVAALENRVPLNLAEWDVLRDSDAVSSPDPLAYTYTLYRETPMDEPLRRAFSVRMGEQGIACRRVSSGYRLTLLHENRHRYSRSL